MWPRLEFASTGRIAGSNEMVHCVMKSCLYFLLILCPLWCIAQQRGIAVSPDNTLIHFRTYGAGRPVLIINGGPGMNSDWYEGLAIRLSTHFRTIIYDQRGTGKSLIPKPDSSTITLELMLEDIEAIRKQLDLESWFILGQSFGGMVASAYAAVYPGRIDKLVLSSSGGIGIGSFTETNQLIFSNLTPIQRDSLAYWNKRIAKVDTTFQAILARSWCMAPAYVKDKSFLPSVAHRLSQSNGLISQLMWNDLRHRQFDCSNQLSTFVKPVLIIQGDEDIVSPLTAATAHKAFRNSKLVFIENCRHFGWLDNPEVYFREIDAFLSAVN
jgi:proline iminopeptidase